MKLTTTFFLLFISQLCLGTAQHPDYIIEKGDTLPIFSNPLEQYFEKTGKREIVDFVGCGSTACWRGYIAYWELRNNKLFLLKITTCNKYCGETKDANLFKMFGTDSVYAEWFSGIIAVPKGKLIQYVHMGYSSIYEEEEHLIFQKGFLTSSYVKSNKAVIEKIEERNRNWNLTKKSLDTIFHYIKRKINWGRLDKSPHLCDDVYLLYFGANGKIQKVLFEPIFDTQKENEEYNEEEKLCRKKIKNALKRLKLNYLNPASDFVVRIEVFYDSDKKILELWKPTDMEDEEDTEK